ncbi:MAG: D-sedoheptulose-7-phosphate isomerase [Phycisphaerales bacterium]
MLARSIRDASEALHAFLCDTDGLERLQVVADALAGVLQRGGKILAAGNGGSCCDAMHFAEELTGRFRDDRPPLPAIACTDPGHLTCVANDYGFDEVFARWVRGLGRPEDAVVLLSTSGNSSNIVRAAEAAGAIGMMRVALLGKSGGTLAGVCEHEWIVPGQTADRIQELHMLILHTLIEGIEQRLGP